MKVCTRGALRGGVERASATNLHSSLIIHVSRGRCARIADLPDSFGLPYLPLRKLRRFVTRPPLLSGQPPSWSPLRMLSIESLW